MASGYRRHRVAVRVLLVLTMVVMCGWLHRLWLSIVGVLRHPRSLAGSWAMRLVDVHVGLRVIHVGIRRGLQLLLIVDLRVRGN